MVRCFYKWAEYDKGKNGFTENQCLEKAWGPSKKYCIFHDTSKDKDTRLFDRKLREKCDSKNYSFRGYYFPTRVNFFNMEFDNNVDFTEAVFQEDADFTNATFRQNAIFNEATFRQNAMLNKATFQSVSFDNATFQQNAAFNKATFQNVSFDNATFQHYTDFVGTTSQSASFDNATFQQNAVFNKSKFQSASFDNTTFQRNVDFVGVIFERNAFFTSAIFQQNAVFDETRFQQNVAFNKAILHSIFFNNTTFHNVSFNGTVIERNMKFSPREINLQSEEEQIIELDLQNAQFLFKGHFTANLAKTKFHEADLDNVAFTNCIWPEKLYEEEYMNFSYRDLETIYRNLKQNLQRHGDYSQAGKFFYREMEMKRKGKETQMKERFRKKFKIKDKLKKENFEKIYRNIRQHLQNHINYSRNKKSINKKIKVKQKGAETTRLSWLTLYYLLAGYGERPLRTVAASLSVISIFAFVYLGFGCLPYPEETAFFQQIIDAFYFSFVIFTTLGLSDIHPSTNIGKALVCSEAAIGAFLIALFVVVFVRKMT